jgi:dihydroxyacetone kinase-like protein
MGDLMATVSLDRLIDWLARFDALVTEQRSYLTELDSAIGDGDHGANLVRGLAAASAKEDAEKPDHVDDLFKLVGMALIGSVGGASGPLYGTFFLRFSASAGHVTELTPEALAAGLDAGLRGIVERGKAERDDKTMFDAIEPAVRAFETGIAVGDVAQAAALASRAAQAGRDATAGLVARKGRASYLGERSVGHIDPGAASAALLFQALAEALA